MMIMQLFSCFTWTNGEDGSIQGFLEVLRMPYVGTNILSSSVAMDKITTKQVLATVGVPQVAYQTYFEGDDLEHAIKLSLETLSFPIFVKPANMGSSVGISKATDESSLRSAIDLALKYDSRILIEQGVTAREIEVGILGNNDVKTTFPGEVVKDVDFYDYDAKYIDNKITMDIPAKVDEATMEAMRQYASKALKQSGLVVYHAVISFDERWTNLLKRTEYNARFYSVVNVSPALGKYGANL